MDENAPNSDELVLRWVRNEVERFIRSHPGGEAEAREALRRAAEPYLPTVRARVEEILVGSTDPDELAKAAELHVTLSKSTGEGCDS